MIESQEEINKKLKSIDKEAQRLAEEKEQLLSRQREIEAMDAQLDELVKKSGFDSPKDLIDALIAKYGVRPSNGRMAPARGKKRTRTRVSAELRDRIKEEVNAGNSMNAVSKQHGISYIVVSKIMKGQYDHL